MIDFRYHLVSLISVFLALAVGIILGAGPLQGAIGEQLTDQVDALRNERNALREDIDAAQENLGEQRRFVDAAGDQLVAGSLAAQRIAVVDVDQVDDDTERAVLDELDDAGARVVAHESLTESWTAADESTLRDTVAGGLREQLGEEAAGNLIDDESNTAELLGAALTVALTDTDADAPGQRSSEAQELQQLLERVGLIEVESAPDEPADAILLLSGGATDMPEEPTEGGDPETMGAAALATLAGTASELAATVLAGPTTTEGDLIATVRGDEELVDTVTTVSGIEQRTGQIVVPLAIASTRTGVVDQYGFEEGATVLPPPAEQTSGGGGGSAAGDQDGSGSGDES